MNKYLFIVLLVGSFSFLSAYKTVDTLYYFLDPINVFSTAQNKNSPISFNVLGMDDIGKDKNKLTLNKILHFVPGLTVMNENNFAQDSRISIRGVGSRSSFGVRGIKILVDGVPESTPDGQSQLDNIDLSFIKSLQIYQGANSPFFGNASGGTINFITSNTNSKDLLEINSNFGKNKLSKHAISIVKNRKNINYQLNFLNKKQAGYRNHSDMESNNLNAILSFGGTGSETYQLFFNYVNSPISNDPGSLTIEQVNTDRTLARGKNVLFRAGESVIQHKTTIKYKNIINKNYFINNYIFFLERSFKNRLPFETGGQVQFDRGYFGFGGSLLKQKQYETINHKLFLSYQILSQQDLRKRYNNLEGLRGDMIYDAEESFNSYGLSLHNSIFLKSNVNLTAGFRLERNDIELISVLDDCLNCDYNVTYNNVSPFLGFSYDYSEYLNYYFNLTQNFETPTLYEIGNNPYDNGENFNTSLKPVVTPSAELGLKINKNEFYRFNFSLYYSGSSNELVPYEIEVEPGRTYYRNAGSTSKFGAEFFYMINVQDFYNIKATYSFADHVYEDYYLENINLENKTMPLSPKHQSALEFQLLNLFSTQCMFRLINVGDFFADDMNKSLISGYTVIDFGISKNLNLFQNNFDLQLYINNVLNESYFTNIRMNAFGGRFYEPADAFSIILSLSYTL
tara:strand:- start:8591 stop:10633 length:2043 start_codon:yes stop_codon:yes gene_type:complete